MTQQRHVTRSKKFHILIFTKLQARMELYTHPECGLLIIDLSLLLTQICFCSFYLSHSKDGAPNVLKRPGICSIHRPNAKLKKQQHDF